MSEEIKTAGSKRTLGDYDVWYLPCERCGYDTAKCSLKDVKRCWKCANRIYRDYSDRALKVKPQAPAELNLITK